MVVFILNRRKSELDLVQDIQFLGIRLCLDLGEALLPESKARKIVARACELSSLQVLSYHRVSQFMGSLNYNVIFHSLGLGFSAPGPPGHDSYGQFDGSFLYQQAKRDPVPYLVASNSGAFYVVTSSEQEQDTFQAV